MTIDAISHKMKKKHIYSKNEVSVQNRFLAFHSYKSAETTRHLTCDRNSDRLIHFSYLDNILLPSQYICVLFLSHFNCLVSY